MGRSTAIGIGVVLLVAAVGVGAGLLFIDQAESVVPAFPDPKPLPNTPELATFEREVYAFLAGRTYATAEGWGHDKGLRVRDTGPWIDHTYYGTHPAVRVFYSPEVVDWIEGGRRGALPEGAMIVKEMLTPPAARYGDWPTDEIDRLCEVGKMDTEFGEVACSWTAMIRDPEVARDGWFWISYDRPEDGDPDAGVDLPGEAAFAKFGYPASGYGQYCTRCHSSAEREMTFSSPRNIEGMPGEPIRFRVDESWRVRPVADPDDDATHPGDASEPGSERPTDGPLKEAFEAAFPQQQAVPADEVSKLPPVDWDWVLPQAGEPTQFATSSQCISCHDGQAAPFGPNMFLPGTDDHPALNLSPYGEWRWSMMGLAGRDPIFHAQLESEVALWPTEPLASAIQNLCTSCHGVMGQRQFEIDEGVTPHLGGAADFLNTEGPWFLQDFVLSTGDSDAARYGALARDGISCMACHQVEPTDDRPLLTLFSGNFDVAPPEDRDGEPVNQIFGPYDDVATRAMVDSLGMDPRHSTYVSSARLCGSCHTVRLPVLDEAGNVQMRGGEPVIHFEQATYLEWANSAYGDEFGYEGRAGTMTCQGCHMQAHYEDPETGEDLQLMFRIANIQDQTYPEADEEAPVAELTVPIREYRRHTLQGINLFGLEMFSQFPAVLGVDVADFMTGSDVDLANAIAAGERLASARTASVTATAERQGDGLGVVVDVESLVGHRFPSGVGFRRAFLEVKVLDAAGEVLWASGSTDQLGRILGPDGQPLPTEFPTVEPDGTLVYQRHHQVITEPTEVQIYEELALSPEGDFTTNFLNRDRVVKDNRMIPRGWTVAGPPGDEFTEEFAEETWPIGDVWPDAPTMPTQTGDRDFLDSPGSDRVIYRIAGVPGAQTVEVVLHYQAIPPAYLADRFEQARGEHGRRLYFLAANLEVDGTPISDWTVQVASATVDLP